MHDQFNAPSSNTILSGMSPESLERLQPHFENVDLPHGTRLYEAFGPVGFVYFFDSGVSSIVASTSDGATVEIGMSGYEGAAGLDVVMNVDELPNSCVMQVGGSGRRLATKIARQEFAENEEFRSHTLLYLHKFMSQVGQTAICNRVHQIEQRLAKWLLMCHDRVEGDLMPLTHEYLAMMLGVSRVSVSLTAAGFQNLGLVKYSRGSLTVLDRKGIEELSCECYSVIKREYMRTV